MQRTSFLQQATSKKARHFTALVGLGVGLYHVYDNFCLPHASLR